MTATDEIERLACLDPLDQTVIAAVLGQTPQLTPGTVDVAGSHDRPDAATEVGTLEDLLALALLPAVPLGRVDILFLALRKPADGRFEHEIRRYEHKLFAAIPKDGHVLFGIFGIVAYAVDD